MSPRFFSAVYTRYTSSSLRRAGGAQGGIGALPLRGHALPPPANAPPRTPHLGTEKVRPIPPAAGAAAAVSAMARRSPGECAARRQLLPLLL